MTTVALLGNPNTGKTTLFNELTDKYAYVGNWTGVTVEKKMGRIRHSEVEMVDLPESIHLIQSPKMKQSSPTICYITTLI